MARSNANVGYKATFEIGTNASPISYTQIAEVKSIKSFEMTTPVVDVSHLQSPNFTQEKRPGMIQPGTVELSGNFTGDDSQMTILGMQQSGEVFPFRVQAPVNNSTKTYQYTGTAFISKYTPGTFEATKVNEFTITMEVTGFVTEDVLDTAMPDITS
ncbi:MAG TPA: phage tail tube protein [Edaphobacter sp.]|nr:phage tail tube protein [Edaphobacter sp.]